MRSITKRHPLLTLLLLVSFVYGCASTPRERYYQADAAYTRTLQGVQLATLAGKLDEDDLTEIEPFRAAVRAALDRAQTIIDADEVLTWDDVRLFDAALDAWLNAMLARQGVTIDPKTGAVIVRPETETRTDGI